MRSNFKMLLALLILGLGLAWGGDHLARAHLSWFAKVGFGLIPAAIYFLFSRRRIAGIKLMRLSEFLSAPSAVFGMRWGAASEGAAEWLKGFEQRGAEVLVAVDPEEPAISNSVLLMGSALELEDRAAISRLAAEVELLRPPELKKRFPGTPLGRTPVYELSWE